MRKLRIFTWHIHGSYLYYLSQVPYEIYVPVKEGRPQFYNGIPAGGFPWPENIHEVSAENVRRLRFDCILFQSDENYLSHKYEILNKDQLRLPCIFLEHDPPRKEPTDTRHPVNDPDVLLVHVTRFGKLIGVFKDPVRAGLPVIALNAHAAELTSWSEGISYEDLFARQVEALGKPGDVLLGIGVHGRAPEMVRAFEMARRRGLRCISMLGVDGGDVHALTDVSIVVPSLDKQKIQEVQLVIVHLLCEVLERQCSSGKFFKGDEGIDRPDIFQSGRRRTRHSQKIQPAKNGVITDAP